MMVSVQSPANAAGSFVKLAERLTLKASKASERAAELADASVAVADKSRTASEDEIAGSFLADSIRADNRAAKFTSQANFLADLPNRPKVNDTAKIVAEVRGSGLKAREAHKVFCARMKALRLARETNEA